MGDKTKTRRALMKLFKICLILVVVFIIGAVAFTFFKIDTDGRHALREAKNVKLALRSIDIEFYGEGKSVYDASSPNGLTKGAISKVREMMPDSKGDIKIISYNKKRREITGLIYSTGHFQILYLENDSETEWAIDYMWRLADFVEEK